MTTPRNRARWGRLVAPVAAAGLCATALSFPLPSYADDTSSPTPSAGGFSGYSASGVATPVKVEIYEPTIPVPTTPQGEFDIGYTKVKANSAGGTGRASFMWPGDAVGEGLKTFFEQLGLPTQLVEHGYPVQVNSQYPSSETTQKNTPLPGTSMTTTSAKGDTRATVGFSTDCNAGDGAGDEPSDDQGDGGTGLPEVPGVPLLDNLDDILTLIGLGRTSGDHRTGKAGSTKGSGASGGSGGSGGSGDGSAGSGDGSDGSGEQADADVCQLPTALAAVVDLNGYVADTHAVSDGTKVTSTSRAALGDVQLVGGIVTMSGITSTVVSASDGTTGQSKGRADYGTITIAGQTFGIGPEGYVAQGTPSPIPGLPDDPAAALATLGISVQLPKPAYKAVGDKASGTVEGLVVTIDLKTLKPVLSQIQLGPILDQLPFPPEAGPLKSLLGAIGNLSPKIVLHLGYTTSAVDTVQAIPIPSAVPDNDPTGDPTEDAEGGSDTGGATGGGTTGGAGVGGSTSDVPPADSASGTTPEATSAQLAPAAGPGLPPLFSIPGMLLVAGIAGALLGGSYVRRLGALVLGAGGPCTHGLESGLPDLRQVR